MITKKALTHKAHDEHHHGDQDPHAWHSLANIRVYIDNISSALITADSANKDYYQANKRAYLAKIDSFREKTGRQSRNCASGEATSDHIA